MSYMCFSNAGYNPLEGHGGLQSILKKFFEIKSSKVSEPVIY